VGQSVSAIVSWSGGSASSLSAFVQVRVDSTFIEGALLQKRHIIVSASFAKETYNCISLISAFVQVRVDSTHPAVRERKRERERECVCGGERKRVCMRVCHGVPAPPHRNHGVCRSHR